MVFLSVTRNVSSASLNKPSEGAPTLHGNASSGSPSSSSPAKVYLLLSKALFCKKGDECTRSRKEEEEEAPSQKSRPHSKHEKINCYTRKWKQERVAYGKINPWLPPSSSPFFVVYSSFYLPANFVSKKRRSTNCKMIFLDSIKSVKTIYFTVKNEENM